MPEFCEDENKNEVQTSNVGVAFKQTDETTYNSSCINKSIVSQYQTET